MLPSDWVAGFAMRPDGGRATILEGMLQHPRDHSCSPDSPNGSVWQLLKNTAVLSPVNARWAPWIMSLSWLLVSIFPWFLGQAVDAAVAGRSGFFTVLIVVMGLLAAVAFPALALRHHATFMTRLSTSTWLPASLSQQVMRVGAAGRDDLPAGEVMASATSDAQSMSQLSMNRVQAFGWSVALVVSIGLTATASWKLALELCVGVVLSALVTHPLSTQYRKRVGKQRRAMAELTEFTTDGVAGLRVLRGVGAQEEFLSGYQGRSDTARDLSIGAGISLAAVMALASVTPGVLTLCLVVWGAFEVRSGGMQPGGIVMVAAASRFLQMPIGQIGMFASAIGRGQVATRRLNAIYSVERPAEDPSQDGQVPDLPLTDPVTGLCVPAGQISVLSSTSAADAGDLARRLAALDPREPVAEVGGRSLTEWPVPARRRAIVLHDAHPMLLSGTLRNQLDPRRDYSDAHLLDALHVAAADDVLSLLPDGLEDYVSERGRSLSGGQRQRVALARVVARDPQVLILVEPTSAVDTYTESLIAQRLRERRAGKTTLIISSSPMMREIADNLMELDRTVSVSSD